MGQDDEADRVGAPAADGPAVEAPSSAAVAAASSPAGDGPDPADAEASRRRAADRRARATVVAAAAALVALSWLDSLPALFLGLAVLQGAAFGAAARQRRAAGARGAETGVPRVVATPAGRVWLSVAWGLVLVAIFLPSAPLRLAVCLGFALSAATWPLVRRNGARVRLARRVPARARAGSPTAIEYEAVAVGAGASRSVAVHDNLGLLARPGAVEVVFDVVGATPVVASAPVAFERRGWKRLRPPRVVSRFPLGLFEVACDVAAPAALLVRPREGRATAALLARLLGAGAPRVAGVRPQPGVEEPYGVRPYRVGDDPRRIHWRTTARRGQTTVVERRDEAVGEVVVALGRGVGRGPEADRRFERAVSVAATVLRALVRQGVRTRLVLGDDAGPAGTCVRGRPGLERALDALALVRAVGDRGAGARRPAAAIAAFAAGARTRGGLAVVWVSAGEDAPPVPGPADVIELRADDPGLARSVTGLP